MWLRVDSSDATCFCIFLSSALEIGDSVRATWHITLTELIMINELRFAAAASDDAVGFVCLESWMVVNCCGDIVPFFYVAESEINDI